MDLITATQAEGKLVREEKDIYIRLDVFGFWAELEIVGAPRHEVLSRFGEGQ